MMRIIIAVMAFIAADAANSQNITGNDLLRWCPSALVDPASMTDIQMLQATSCVNYLNGFVDGHIFAASFADMQTGTKLKRLFCEPERGVPIEQRVRILIKYLERTPAKLHENGRILVSTALNEAFPCK